MSCAYHPVNSAAVRCHSCARPLCPSCDHRIKGFTYCEDCIVAGVGLLRQGQAWSGYHAGAPVAPAAGAKAPGIAFLLGLIPGLGAAYNGQSIKALLHFAVTAGLWELADIFNSGMLGLAGGAFYIFSLYDAWQSARRFNLGADLRAEDEQLRQLLRDNTHVWGGALLGIGALAILHTILNRFWYFRFPGAWPLILVLAGLFLLRWYRQENPAPASAPTEWKQRVPPPSVIQRPYDR
ncbi:MAG: B-box zinc finger protein [Blastocatellia bacterium]